MLAVRMCPDAHVLMVVVCVVCMNPAGRAVDADQGAHICCVCAAKCRKWAKPRRLPGNPHMPLGSCCAQGMRRCAECCRLQGGCGRLQTEHGRCAQTMRHGADCGRLQGGCTCGRLQTEHGQIWARADRMCHSPIGNCQVLCAASAHTCGGGGVAYLL